MTEPSPPSPLAMPLPWNLVSSAYAAEVVPLFERYAEDAMRLVGLERGHDVVDVATGPGTLAVLAARRGARVHALDFADAMIGALRQRAAAERLEALEAHVGDGMALPFDGASFDRAFSMFGLMFFPDRGLGFRELHRTLRPGGKALVASWQPMDRVPELAQLFAAMRAMMPDLPFGKNKAPLGEPDECIAEMSAAGFEDATVHEITHTLSAPSTTEFWAHACRTMAPLVLLQAKLGEAWPGIASGVQERLVAELGDGPIAASMRANLTEGRR